jgi:hypothetical protein
MYWLYRGVLRERDHSKDLGFDGGDIKKNRIQTVLLLDSV